MRVDLYKAIGAPALANTEDLLNALKLCRKLSCHGRRCKNLPFFHVYDWDGIYMKFAITMIALYGYRRATNMLHASERG